MYKLALIQHSVSVYGALYKENKIHPLPRGLMYIIVKGVVWFFQKFPKMTLQFWVNVLSDSHMKPFFS